MLVLLAVSFITIGYAAYSSSLNISSEAEVKPDSSNFDVDFSSSADGLDEDDITPTLNKVATGFSASEAIIDNTGNPIVSGIKVTFTEPGQTATYSFYSYNKGKYLAYLKNINFNGNKTCTALEGTTQSLVSSACSGISLSIKVGDEESIFASSTLNNHTLLKNSSENINITITYAEGSDIADGDFEVTLPSIELVYSSN